MIEGKTKSLSDELNKNMQLFEDFKSSTVSELSTFKSEVDDKISSEREVDKLSIDGLRKEAAELSGMV